VVNKLAAPLHEKNWLSIRVVAACRCDIALQAPTGIIMRVTKSHFNELRIGHVRASDSLLAA
jgi:hypothetical protein